MNRHSSSLPLWLSFSELAWIALLLGVLDHDSELSNIRKQLTEREATINDLSDRLSTLQQQHKALQKAYAMLVGEQKQTKTKYESLQASYSRLADEHERTKAKLSDSQRMLHALEMARQSLRDGLNQANKELMQLRKELNDARSRIVSVEAKLEAARQRIRELEAARVPGPLLGLRGSLKRVAIVFDRSGSMSSQQGGRWEHAVDIVETWLSHLEMEHCALILFATDVELIVSDDGTAFHDMRGAASEAARRRLADRLRREQPTGGTNTLQALKAAYALRPKVDTILLFTDGAPNDGHSNEFDAGIAGEIYQVCQAHPGVVVNAIGLGNYFEDSLAGFLQEVARITEGAFLGR